VKIAIKIAAKIAEKIARVNRPLCRRVHSYENSGKVSIGVKISSVRLIKTKIQGFKSPDYFRTAATAATAAKPAKRKTQGTLSKTKNFTYLHLLHVYF